MLFYVSIAVQVPHGVDPEEINRLKIQEVERGKELFRLGKWPHVWRVVGKWANISIFDVDSPTELHAILSSLPLFPYMQIEITALCEMRPSVPAATK